MLPLPYSVRVVWTNMPQFNPQFERSAAHDPRGLYDPGADAARDAAAHGEVPVGCVIVRDGKIIGRGRNRREEKQAVSSHAEMEAMAQANEALGSWRLEDCDLYVTLEPCPMCAGSHPQRAGCGGCSTARGIGPWAPAAASEPVHGGFSPSSPAGRRHSGGGLPDDAIGVFQGAAKIEKHKKRKFSEQFGGISRLNK